MNDAWQYAVWPDSRSRSRSWGLWSSENCTFQSLSPPLIEGDGNWPVDRAGFLKFVLVFVSRDLKLGVVPAVSPSTKKVFPLSVKFGVYIQVHEWCTTVCCLTRLKVKVTSNWKPLKRRWPSVPHGAKFYYATVYTTTHPVQPFLTVSTL